MKLTSLIGSLSPGLLSRGRYSRLRSYHTVLNSLSAFCLVDEASIRRVYSLDDGPSSLPPLSVIFTPDFLHRYEQYLIRLGRKCNTISTYLNALRSLERAAVDQGLIPACPDLFSGIFTGVDTTPKRALSPDVIACIFSGDLSGKPSLVDCRNYMVLAILLQGMSFIDLAHLRKSDVQGDVVRYRRHKTGGVVEVALLPEVRDLFSLYADRVRHSPYLLPILPASGSAAELRHRYDNALRLQNEQLKSLAAYLGITETLTTHVARHSWATLAYFNAVDVGLVGQGMGHCLERTTRIYLDSFSVSRLTVANSIVLRAVLTPIVEGRVDNVPPEVMERACRRFKSLSRVIANDRKTVMGRNGPSLPPGFAKKSKWRW